MPNNNFPFGGNGAAQNAPVVNNPVTAPSTAGVNAQTQGFANQWSLVAFVSMYGMPKLATVNDPYTGQTEQKLYFENCPNKNPKATRAMGVFLNFGPSVQGLQFSQIGQFKDQLQVVELAESHNLMLCKQGDGGWQTLNLW